MNGKTCLITGGTSGIGEAAALALAERGAELAILCRSPERGAETKERIEAQAGRACVQLFVADMASLDQVRRVSAEIMEQLPRIDVLLNNAGVTMLKRSETVDGFETTFAVNHLAPFLLTHELLPKILETRGARIVNVASAAHRFARFDLEDLQSEKQFSSMRVYGASKLANILFTRHLAQRLAGRDLGIWSLHPGAVSTRLGANNGGIAKLVIPLMSLFFKTAEQGARTSVYLCSEPKIAAPNGTYFADEQPANVSALASDPEVARSLWEESERMVGIEGSANWA